VSRLEKQTCVGMPVPGVVMQVSFTIPLPITKITALFGPGAA